VLPGCGASEALTLAERLRQSMAAEPIADNAQAYQVTLSFGVSVWDSRLHRARVAAKRR